MPAHGIQQERVQGAGVVVSHAAQSINPVSSAEVLPTAAAIRHVRVDSSRVRWIRSRVSVRWMAAEAERSRTAVY